MLAWEGTMSEQLDHARKFLEEGNCSQASSILIRIVVREPNNIDAWWLLAQAVETPNKQIDCLRRVLALDPNHLEARLMLDLMSSEEAAASPANADAKSGSIPHPSSMYPPQPTMGVPVEIPVIPGASETGQEDVQQSAGEPKHEEQEDEEDTQVSLSATMLQGPWVSKRINRWEQPFENEKQLVEHFESFITDLLKLINGYQLPVAQEHESMIFALSKYKEWSAAGQFDSHTNVFLSPAFVNSGPIAYELFERRLFKEAAWVANNFGEIGKILVSRNHDKYGQQSERILGFYCRIMRKYFEQQVDSLKSPAAPELTHLRQRMEAVVRFALGTTFRHGRFDRNFNPDQVLMEDLINENLAVYFEERLAYLLNNSLPRVSDFFSHNLPIVYRLRLDEHRWYDKMGRDGEWEQAITDAGFGDILYSMRAMGDLVIPSRVGLLPPQYLDEVRSAGEDYNQVRNLLRATADEVRQYLASAAGEHLKIREPQSPHFHPLPNAMTRPNRGGGRYEALEGPADRFRNARHLMYSRPVEALEIVQSLWENDLENTELREWTAVLHQKNNNPAAAETHLRYLHEHRNPASNRVVDWNLAVLLYNRKDIAGAYQLILPWVLKHRLVDQELLEAVLALALILKEYGQFLSLIPRTYHLRFHALAFQIAYDLGDRSQQKLIHTQLVHQLGNRWELPPVETKFSDPQDLSAEVSRAIVKYQLDQVIAWLQDRIQLMPNSIYNYLELVRVAEKEKGDLVLAYETLIARLSMEKKSGSSTPQKIAIACRDLLDLCKRQHLQAKNDEERQQRREIGRKAYQECKAAGASADVLASYSTFKPDEDPWTSFQTLRDQLEATSKSETRSQEAIDALCERMFELADEANLSDLGRKVFDVTQKASASTWLHEKYSRFSPSMQGIKKTEPITDPAEEHTAPQELPITDEFLWVTAELQRIRSVKAYIEQGRVVQKLIDIIKKVSPVDSGTIVSLIENISNAMQAFLHTNSDQSDERKMLYNRAADYTKRLEGLLTSGTLSPSMTNLLRPYHEGTLRSVMGDFSREIGISPRLEAVVVNRFISPEIELSTLVLRLTNTSERQVTAVFVEIIIEGDVIRLRDRSSAKLSVMEPKQSALLAFPIEKYHMRSESEVVISISLRASAEGYQNVDIGVIRRSIPLKTLEQEIGLPFIPSVFKPGKPLELKDEALFHGRSELINSVCGSFYGGEQSKRYFLDGIRRVGKTSLLNFLPRYLPDPLLPVNINLEGLGIEQQHLSPSTYLHRLCEMILKKLPSDQAAQLVALDRKAFETNPGDAFENFLSRVTEAYGGKKILLMIDEFQMLLEATKNSPLKDALVLDQMRFQADHGQLYVLFTGSVRYDRLSHIYDHRIVGSLSRLRISFLSKENMAKVLRAALEQWVMIPEEAIDAIYEMSGGYPRLIHEYGAHLVDLMNREHRTVIIPGDVEYVTRMEVLNNNELFSHRWPVDQFGTHEERFIEYLLNKFKDRQEVSVPEFFGSVPPIDLAVYRQALENLRAFEVLDSSRPELIGFQGKAIKLWAELHVDPITRRFTPPKSVEPNTVIDYGHAGIFIDHENTLKALERISGNRGTQVPRDGQAKAAWLKSILNNMLREAEKRVRQLDYRVSVAFWARPNEAVFTPGYAELGFANPQPIDVAKANAVDFKLMDEVQLAARTSVEKRTRLARAIVVSGDGDMAQTINSLKTSNVEVQVWGGSGETKKKYIELVGEQNVIALEDVCGL
jgi:hypothetical protein